MEVRQDKQGRTIRRGQGVERPDGRQRVCATGVGSLTLCTTIKPTTTPSSTKTQLT